MDARHGLMAAAGLLVWGSAVWVAALWWFGRKLRQAAGQQDRVDKARQFAAQQASQARRQVESLQNEMAELRQQLTALKRRTGQPETAPAPLPWPVEAPPSSNDGFADTQIQLPRKR